MYEAASTGKDSMVEDLLRSESAAPSNKGMSEATKQVLLDAIGGFFFFDADDAENDTHINLFMKALERETCPRGAYVMKEGEDGDKLYVLESGELEVTIGGEFIRTMTSGALFGELALLYSAPRSATIKCSTESVFWCLDRSVFKAIQRVARSAMVIQRSEWLTMCPEIKNLGSVELSRLMNSLETVEFKEGEVLHDFDSPINRVLLIEKGTVHVEGSPEHVMTPREWDVGLGITRGKIFDYGKSNESRNWFELHEGSIIGTAALDVKARKKSSGGWKYKDGKVFCSVKLTAMQGGVKCSVFNIDQFVHLFGESPKPTAELIRTATHREESFAAGRSPVPNQDVVEIRKFDPSKMEYVGFLGQGGYGTVLKGKYKGDDTEYAVKFLVKATIIAKKTRTTRDE